MKKMKSALIAGCLICMAVAIGTMVACSTDSNAPEQSISSSGKKNYNYAPDISVDWGEYSEKSIPNAVLNTPYRVFTATAEDAYGDALSVSTKVYLHYLEDTKALVTLKDNSITPTHYGVYTVEYTAVDMFGKPSVYTYDFTCDDVKTLSISLSDEKVTTALAGNETKIAKSEYQNNFGLVKTEITATRDDGKVVYDLTDKTSFVPMYAGTYTVEYAFSDYNLTVKKSYDLTVEANDAPVFISDAVMPKYFIVGKKYTLPSAEVYLFATGKPVPTTPAVSVRYGKGQVEDLDGYEFTPEKEGELTFYYTAKNGSESVTREYKAHAIDVGKAGDESFDIAKYFYSENALVTAGYDSVKVRTSTDKAEVEFINTLPSRGFSIKFATAQIPNFETLDIFLKDSADETVSLKITYAKPKKEGANITVNDGEEYMTKGFEYDAQTISFNETTMKVAFNDELIVDCPDDFAGFPSGKINVSLKFNTVRDVVEFEIYRLNNHTLFECEEDSFAPQFWFEVSSRETYRINEVVSLGKIYYGDVLDSDVTVKISVLAQDSGNFAVSTAGETLNKFPYKGDMSEFDFPVTEYGDYRISYTVEDSYGNGKTYNYSINVRDIVPPTAAFVSDMPVSVKAGEKFTLSEIVYSDDISAAENCEVTIILIGGPVGDVRGDGEVMKDGNADVLEAGKTYRFNTKGNYYLYYIVSDEANNTTVLCHRFTVE